MNDVEKHLYHAIPTRPEGDCIRPSKNYGTRISPDIQKKLGIPESDQEKVPLVFAANHIGKALAFCFPKAEKNILLNGTFNEEGLEYAIVVNRVKTMGTALDATIYRFSGRDFFPLEGAQQQVSKYAVPFHETEPVLHIKKTDDLMRAGLQIFSLEKGIEEIGGWERIEKRIHDEKLPIPELIRILIIEGKLVWENSTRNINPASEIKAFLQQTPKVIPKDKNSPCPTKPSSSTAMPR